MQRLQDIRVSNIERLTTPRSLKEKLPVTQGVADVVCQGREEVEGILSGRDSRLLVVVGPCSIHDINAAMEYARRLKALRDELKDDLCIIMRVYFEKPRTTIGWKGFINDPHLDGTFDIEHGLYYARKLLLDINALGLPAATEFLDPFTPQYVADLVSWAAIGARTIESQTHRQMASGLSMPVGFKNSTDGRVQAAIDAIRSAMHSHSFLGIDADGHSSVITTTGNPYGHMVLRGGSGRPNYDAENIADAERRLEKEGLDKNLLVDCSHANSGKNYERQSTVWNSIIEQRVTGTESILGVMLESNLLCGKQSVSTDPSSLQYGVSITDACISWEETATLLRDGAMKLHPFLSRAEV
ncbi:MAG: 3-deoxy-7-phosphoheptulonate synthase [Prosthecochloris sp.]|nr:3-deoxy-7-phosphoheptulonate synthase [Prosthecochloris sp.]